MFDLAFFFLAPIICALDWRYRGMRGSPGGWTTAILVTAACWPLFYPVVGWWGLLYILWFGIGEHSGWKPKWAKDHGNWWETIRAGALIGGVGAILVPLSVWIHRHTRIEPPASWSYKMRHLFESAAQNELWFGLLAPSVTYGFWYIILLITKG